jgi:hypothetical protein
MDNWQQQVVILMHENGSREFCRIDYFADDGHHVSGSVGFNAVGGDIEKARTQLYSSDNGNIDKTNRNHP